LQIFSKSQIQLDHGPATGQATKGTAIAADGTQEAHAATLPALYMPDPESPGEQLLLGDSGFYGDSWNLTFTLPAQVNKSDTYLETQAKHEKKTLRDISVDILNNASIHPDKSWNIQKYYEFFLLQFLHFTAKGLRHFKEGSGRWEVVRIYEDTVTHYLRLNRRGEILNHPYFHQRKPGILYRRFITDMHVAGHFRTCLGIAPSVAGKNPNNLDSILQGILARRMLRNFISNILLEYISKTKKEDVMFKLVHKVLQNNDVCRLATEIIQDYDGELQDYLQDHVWNSSNGMKGLPLGELVARHTNNRHVHQIVLRVLFEASFEQNRRYCLPYITLASGRFFSFDKFIRLYYTSPAFRKHFDVLSEDDSIVREIERARDIIEEQYSTVFAQKRFNEIPKRKPRNRVPANRQ